MADKQDFQADFGRWFRIYEDKGKLNVLDGFSKQDLEKKGRHGHVVIGSEDLQAEDGGFDAFKVIQSLEYVRDIEGNRIKKKDW